MRFLAAAFVLVAITIGGGVDPRPVLGVIGTAIDQTHGAAKDAKKCHEAFEAAAKAPTIGKNRYQLAKAAHACKSTAEWTAAAASHPASMRDRKRAGNLLAYTCRLERAEGAELCDFQ